MNGLGGHKGALLTVVCAALIDGAGRVLVQRRPPGRQHAGLWEFPGGKVEPGEAPAAALARELAEELAITVDPAALEPLAFTSVPAGERHLLLLLHVARGWQGQPRPLEATEMRWMRPEAMGELAMPPADRPLVAALCRLLP